MTPEAPGPRRPELKWSVTGTGILAICQSSPLRQTMINQGAGLLVNLAGSHSFDVTFEIAPGLRQGIAAKLLHEGISNN